MESILRKHSHEKSHVWVETLNLNLPVSAILRRGSGVWTAGILKDNGRKMLNFAFARKDGIDEFASQDVLDGFLQIEKVSDARLFFERYGSFESGKNEYPLRLLRPFQDKVWRMRKLSASRFFHGPFGNLGSYLESFSPPVSFVVGRVPMLMIQSHDVHNAIRHAIYIEHLAGFEFAVCLHCGSNFRLNKTGRRKKYCGLDCEGKAAKKRWNEKQKLGGKANGKA